MITNAQTTNHDSSSGGFLEPDMVGLLKMTNDVIAKIKAQTQEAYL